MMLDADVVAVSASSFYRVLRKAGLLRKWPKKNSSKGAGFKQPLKAHEPWHVDITHVNVCGTFLYLLSVLDGFSRAIAHHEFRTSLTQADVQIVVQRALERYPEAHPRFISDNRPQFVTRDNKSFIRQKGMDHVKKSPYYPASSGTTTRAVNTAPSAT
jgi:putative transposase